MKTLYEFLVTKEYEAEEPVIEKNDAGEEIKVLKKVKKEEHKKLFIKKPNRSLIDEAEMFYSVELAKGIRAGLLTNAMLQKRFMNDGGVLSEDEKNKYTTLYGSYFDKQKELADLSISKPEGYEDKIKVLNEECKGIEKELQGLEIFQSNLFGHTAESKARDKTVVWWILNLAHQEGENNQIVPIFAGDYNKKLEKLFEIEDSEDKFMLDVIRKFMFYISFWNINGASSKEDFDKVTPLIEKQI